jgi:hypothetical protein
LTFSAAEAHCLARLRNRASSAGNYVGLCIPCRRFASALADVCAQFRADVDRYSFIVRDLHPLLLAGLPAHSETSHTCGLKCCRLRARNG